MLKKKPIYSCGKINSIPVNGLLSFENSTLRFPGLCYVHVIKFWSTGQERVEPPVTYFWTSCFSLSFQISFVCFAFAHQAGCDCNIVIQIHLSDKNPATGDGRVVKQKVPGPWTTVLPNIPSCLPVQTPAVRVKQAFYLHVRL